MNSSGTFPRDIAALEGLFELAAKFASANSLEGSQKFLVDFVLEELFTNMVQHNPGAAGRIGVELDLGDTGLTIQLCDPDCDRFDIRTDAPLVETDLPLDARRPGGLGIHLVKRMVDRIEYAHENRTGTIRLYKKWE